jgi:hypothetical protein
MSRQKKYKMKAISSAFSEKGGYSAQFVSDGYTIDARKEILPGIIKANGVQVGEGVAWDLIQAFLKECAARAAATGETVTVGSLITFGLAIRGWFANKDSKASKENVRVTATLLNDLRPTVVFSMSNEIDGVTLTLYTVMGDGCTLGHVKPVAKFRINGKYLQLLEGDKVVASVKNAAGETIEAECVVIESAEDHIDGTLPAAFGAAALAGREITLTVHGRCGDADAGTQVKSITAVLDKGELRAPRIAYLYSEGYEDDHDKLFEGTPFGLKGENLATAAEFELTFKDRNGNEYATSFGSTDGDFHASDTLITINNFTYLDGIRARCAEAESSLDAAAGVDVKVTFADGTVLTHHASMAV